MGIALFLVLIATAGVILYCARADGMPGRMSSGIPWTAHLLTLAPAALVSVVLLQAEGTTDPAAAVERSAAWRVTLSGLQLRLSGAQSIRFGGDPRTDHLHVRGMPPGLLTLQRDAAGALSMNAGSLDGGVVVIRDVGAPAPEIAEPQWGGIAIPAGAKFCRSDSAGCKGPSLSWSPGKEQAQLTSGAGAELCTFPLSVPRRPGELRIYTLAEYARPGCAGTASFAWSTSQPATEFLYWAGPERRPQLYLLPSPGAKYAVANAEGGFDMHQARQHSLASGEQRDVYFHRYVRQEPGAAAKVGRIRDIRSFRLRHIADPAGRASVIEVFLHTAEATRVSLGPEATLTVTSKFSNPTTPGDGAALAGFEVLGAPAAAELPNLVKLESGSRQFEALEGAARECFNGAATLTIRGMSRVDCAAVGRWFSIGDPQYLQAKVRIAPLEVPGTWLAAIWIVVLANLLLRAALSLPTGWRVVLACLETLLALRLVIACDAALVDARQESTVAAAWLALLCIPAAFELAAPVAGARLQVIAARMAKLLVIAAGLWLMSSTLGVGGTMDAVRSVLGQDAGGVIAVLVVLYAALILLLRTASPLSQALQERFPVLATPRGAEGVLLAIAIGHVLLALIGVREQVGGLRVSTVLVPLLVLAWGYWYAVVARHADSWRTVARGIVIAFLPLLGFLIARDNGAYVYFFALAVVLLPLAWPWITQHWLAVLVVGVGLVAMLLGSFTLLDASFIMLTAVASGAAVVAVAGLYVLYRSRRLGSEPRALWALPVGVILSAVAALHVGSLLLSASATVTTAAPARVQELERIVDIDGNAIRLLDLIAPRVVEGLGLRQGYEQRAAMSEMFSYAATLTGRGWPSTTIPRELRVTHVDDTVAAVHLMGPFGRIAALGLAGLLGAFALASTWLLARRDDVAAEQARLAVAALVSVSLYMLFANIGVVPFTGRNFYFLSVASNSDLLEGGLLLAILAAALARTREVGP